ncbi:MAG: hypothetical protein D6798_00715 [Deltaproteobacteria bacterium]|nr:MAG: hypothetical protein D6798_00715 [Deltaproteobacteria bacterium]
MACRPLEYADPDQEGAVDGGAVDSGAADGGATDGGAADCPLGDVAPPADLPTDDWTPQVGLQAGDIEQIVVAHDGRTVWAGSAQNGLWRSDDGGESWDAAMVPITHTYGQMAVHRANPAIVAYSSGQGWISTDAGASFDAFGLPWTGTEQDVRGLVFDGDTLYAAELSGEVFRSDDLGVTWAALGSVPRPAAEKDAGHDTNPDLWLAVTDSGDLLAASSGNGLYRSTDRGESFSLVLPVSVFGGLLTVRGDTVAVAGGSSTATDVYQSTDGGATWTLRAHVDDRLTALHLDADGELVGTTATGWWSESGGLATIDGADADGRPFGAFMAIADTPDGTLLVGHRLGVLASTDGGATWSPRTEEMVDVDLINIGLHPACPSVVFTGTQCRSGLYMSTDYGGTFDRPPGAALHYTMATFGSPAAPSEIWSTADDVLWWSGDLGQTWTAMRPRSDGQGVHLHGLAVHPRDPATVLVGSVGSGDYADDGAHLYATHDRGATWKVLGGGLPDSEESFHAIHFVTADPDIVLLGTFPAGEGVIHKGGQGDGMFRSTDGGQTWEPVDQPAPSIEIIAECADTLYAATDLGALRSTDRGETWEVVLDSADGVKSVACHGDTVLAIATDLGVRRSDDRGESWADWSGSLQVTLGPINNQLGLGISPDGQVAYAAVPEQGFAMRAMQ